MKRIQNKDASHFEQEFLNFGATKGSTISTSKLEIPFKNPDFLTFTQKSFVLIGDFGVNRKSYIKYAVESYGGYIEESVDKNMTVIIGVLKQKNCLDNKDIENLQAAMNFKNWLVFISEETFWELWIKKDKELFGTTDVEDEYHRLKGLKAWKKDLKFDEKNWAIQT